MPSFLRGPSFSRVLGSILGIGVLSVSVAPTAQGEELGLGFTDLRLSLNAMPTSSFTVGGVTGDYDVAARMSVMAIGPICGILPVGCYTQPRTTQSAGRSADAYGTYDDLVVETNYSYNTRGSYSYDWLLGLEFSGQLFSRSRDVAAAEAGIDVFTAAATVHIGLGLEIATRTTGRWHWELTPFLGAGFSVAEFTPLVGDSVDNTGFYYEYGARLGTYYTWANGFQLGGNIRAIWTEPDISFNGTSADLGTSGISLGLDLGYRF